MKPKKIKKKQFKKKTRDISKENYAYIKTARERRKDLLNRLTPAEEIFKKFLKELGIKFEIQSIIYSYDQRKIIDYYIADFYLPDMNAIIEIDGEHHNSYKQREDDILRDFYIKRMGYKVYRIQNNLTLNQERLLSLISLIRENKKCESYYFK